MSDSSRSPAVELVTRTDPGRDPDKQVNEDAYAEAETPLGRLAIVCDGMGGHAGGKEASNLAVQAIVERVKAAPPGSDPKLVLRQAIEDANARVWSMPTAEAGLRPGSTVVAALLHEGGADLAHVGDSRIYFVHAGAISQVTRDHSMVQELVDRNIIKAEDAAKHPDANKIMRALGIAKDVEVDVRVESLAFVAGDIFVLCSDGLSDLVTPSEILDIAGSRPPAQAAGQLVDLANARGGHDNITAMVVLMKSSSTPRDPATVVKTVQLTAHAGPHDGGPTGTLVSPPVAPTLVSPVVPDQRPGPNAPPVMEVTPGGHAAIPPAPPPRSTPGGRGRSPLPIIFGLLLALVALGLLAGGAFFWMKPRRHDVRLVDDAKDATALAEDGDDAGPEPVVTAAPPLEAPHHADGGGGWRHGHRDASAHPHNAPAGGTATAPPLPAPAPTLEPPSCAQARTARAKGQNPTVITALEKQCRSAGGTP